MSTGVIVLLGNVLTALLLAPLVWGMGGKVRDWFEGRRGPRVTQLYYDIFKELRKSANYSSATLVFRIAPVMGFCSLVLAAGLMPAGGAASWLGFAGDLFLLAALLNVGRFWMALGALDTGVSGNAMGASRDVYYGVMVTPALFLVLAVLAVVSGGMTLNGMFAVDTAYRFGCRIMVVLALLLIYLAESARMPFEDPDSRYAAAMVKQGMARDYSGPEYGLVLYAGALKSWLFASILVLAALPVMSALPLYLYWPALFAGVSLVVMGGGVLETILGRLPMPNVPQYLLLGYGSALLALIFWLYG
jgi:formate hydrogenlyase subunit 4